MVSTFLLTVWLKAVKHIFLSRVINKGILLTKNISVVKYMSLCGFTSSSRTCTRPVGDCGKIGRKNGAIKCSNIGARKGTDDAVKLEKEDNSRAVRSYYGITREDVQTPLGKNRLIIP